MTIIQCPPTSTSPYLTKEAAEGLRMTIEMHMVGSLTPHLQLGEHSLNCIHTNARRNYIYTTSSSSSFAQQDQSHLGIRWVKRKYS